MTDILWECFDLLEMRQGFLRFSFLETNHAHEQIDLRNEARVLLTEGSGARVLILGKHFHDAPTVRHPAECQITIGKVSDRSMRFGSAACSSSRSGKASAGRLGS